MPAYSFTIDDSSKPAPKVRKNAAKEKKADPIFQTYKNKTLAGLSRSITEAKGRFEEKKPLEVYTPSKMWTVAKADQNQADPSKETVSICLKCGDQQRMAIFDGKTSVKVSATAVVNEMEKLLKAVKAMKKDDGGLGSLFHDTAKKIAARSAGTDKKYDAATDTMVPKK